ncbi:phage head morphogenesis protein [Providencia alcalifaciens]|nr:MULTISPECIES: phage minor head protein [Providencia]MTC39325.1 phage head morphogenesis protein [Providencia alcalifaciens]
MSLPPAEAISYFESKGYVLGYHHDDIEAQAHAKAFTVAGVLKLDILHDIRQALADVLENGETYTAFERRLIPTLEQKGWLGKGFVADMDTGELHGKRLMPRRLDTIFQTNLQSSYMAGRYQQQMTMVDERPYWERVGVMDNRIRPSHAALNGFIARYDDPIWQILYPPDGYRCRCRVRTRSAEDIERLGLLVQSSEGRLVEVEQTYGVPGKTRTVIGFKNPKDGQVYTPDPGFGFNPGLVSYQPELGKYHPTAASQYITGSLTGADFRLGYQEAVQSPTPNPAQRYPVAARPSATGKTADAVYVDAPTMKDLAQHDIELSDYLFVQQIIESPQKTRLSDDGIQYYATQHGRYWWVVAVKDHMLQSITMQNDF